MKNKLKEEYLNIWNIIQVFLWRENIFSHTFDNCLKIFLLILFFSKIKINGI